LIEEGVDVAIRIAELADSSLIARRLAPGHRTVCAAPSYLERFGAPTTPDDLKHHNCLTLSVASALNEWAFEGPEGRRTVRVTGTFEANSVIALHRAALAGLGLLRASRFLVGPDLKAGHLAPVLSDFHCPGDSAIHAVYPHSRHLSPKVRAFVDFLVEKFTPVPPWEI
jgi:DNA-binding transcriptional LysR family regulator